MIELCRMTQAEFGDYYPNALRNLAHEMAKANRVPPNEALTLARRCFETLLPEGKVNVPDQYLFNILVNDRQIGVLWFGIRRDGAMREAVVWDIVIEPLDTGQGYGKMTMLALEKEVRALNISRISLNVFAHNARAQGLYEWLGYRAISSHMLKCL